MRSVSRKRAAAAALVAPLLLLGTVACNDGEGDQASSDVAETPTGTPTETPTETPSETPADDPSESPAAEESETPSGTHVGPAELFRDMIRAMKEQKYARVAMDLGVGIAEGALSYADAQPDMSLTMDMSATSGGMGTIEMRLVDGVMYMSMPPLSKPGKFFKFGSDSKTLGPLVDQLQGFTPDASTELIAKSLKKMTEVGEEKIGADQTTHYVVLVDTKKALQLMGNPRLPQQGGSLPDSIEYDMWVTGDKLLRRIVMTLGASSVQMDYTAWGEPVTIKAPAGADVVESPPGL